MFGVHIFERVTLVTQEFPRSAAPENPRKHLIRDQYFI